MKTISFSGQPPFVAVVDGRRDFRAAVSEARDALCNPAWPCAVVIRDKETLSLTFERAKRTTLSSGDTDYKALGDRQYKLVTLENIHGESCSGEEIEKMIGPDYLQVLETAPEYFPFLTTMELRRDDQENDILHIDFGNPAKSVPYMPGSISATMAVKGGGTIVVAAGKEDFIRIKNHWELPEQHSLSAQDGWQVADGDLCLMRTRAWPATHVPCVHKSPSRKRPGDPNERVVGVFLA